MINKQTIISAYDEKLTLVQWLKSVNKALDEAVLTNVEIAQRGNATFVFVFTFEDGTQVESNEIIVNQGESIVDASIENGHLLLTLSNDDVLDAGNVKPVSSFSFNSARHLIVNYADGTSEDLGLIKGISSFAINESGHLIVNYDNNTSEDLGSLGDFSNVDFVAKTLNQTNANYSLDFNFSNQEGVVIDNIYNRFEVINNMLYIIVNFKATNESESDKSIYQITSGWKYITGGYGAKIVDLENKKVSEDRTGACYITSHEINVISSPSTVQSIARNGICVLQNQEQAGAVAVVCRWDTPLSIPANTSKYICVRLYLTLI